ncbi:hypothetical protein [Oceaniglobus ichthyenteri]|uniref:hypothetical protein n=1 Tax=Oceaniglobus ichthyenteri TaxID=2136177 RepID=UPI000D366D0A|nr:hypothetical protein [Oceaniglobus ichthyenteri]
MSDFTDYLLDQIGDATDTHDINLRLVNCYFYDFDGVPVRLWDGQGVLVTSTGVGDPVVTPNGTIAANEWLGTFDGRGNNMHQPAAVGDERDGASPRYEFTIPYLDRATFDAIRADQDKAKGRSLTCYHVLVRPGEGLRAGLPIRFAYRLTMRGVTFSESREGAPGAEQRVYSARVLARTGEAGRSLAPRGTMTATSLRERSRQLGVVSDSGADFIAGNAQRTYLVGG